MHYENKEREIYYFFSASELQFEFKKTKAKIDRNNLSILLRVIVVNQIINDKGSQFDGTIETTLHWNALSNHVLKWF